MSEIHLAAIGSGQALDRNDEARDHVCGQQVAKIADKAAFRRALGELDKGREDGRDRDSYDPNRHSRYRSADHGYEKRYGSKDQYKEMYREGFRAGYNDAYRQANSSRRGPSSNFPWPF